MAITNNNNNINDLLSIFKNIKGINIESDKINPSLFHLYYYGIALLNIKDNKILNWNSKNEQEANSVYSKDIDFKSNQSCNAFLMPDATNSQLLDSFNNPLILKPNNPIYTFNKEIALATSKNKNDLAFATSKTFQNDLQNILTYYRALLTCSNALKNNKTITYNGKFANNYNQKEDIVLNTPNNDIFSYQSRHLDNSLVLNKKATSRDEPSLFINNLPPLDILKKQNDKNNIDLTSFLPYFNVYETVQDTYNFTKKVYSVSMRNILDNYYNYLKNIPNNEVLVGKDALSTINKIAKGVIATNKDEVYTSFVQSEDKNTKQGTTENSNTSKDYNNEDFAKNDDIENSNNNANFNTSFLNFHYLATNLHKNKVSFVPNLQEYTQTKATPKQARQAINDLAFANNDGNNKYNNLDLLTAHILGSYNIRDDIKLELSNGLNNHLELLNQKTSPENVLNFSALVPNEANQTAELKTIYNQVKDFVTNKYNNLNQKEQDVFNSNPLFFKNNDNFNILSNQEEKSLEPWIEEAKKEVPRLAEIRQTKEQLSNLHPTNILPNNLYFTRAGVSNYKLFASQLQNHQNVVYFYNNNNNNSAGTINTSSNSIPVIFKDYTFLNDDKIIVINETNLKDFFKAYPNQNPDYADADFIKKLLPFANTVLDSKLFNEDKPGLNDLFKDSLQVSAVGNKLKIDGLFPASQSYSYANVFAPTKEVSKEQKQTQRQPYKKDNPLSNSNIFSANQKPSITNQDFFNWRKSQELELYYYCSLLVKYNEFTKRLQYENRSRYLNPFNQILNYNINGSKHHHKDYAQDTIQPLLNSSTISNKDFINTLDNKDEISKQKIINVTDVLLNHMWERATSSSDIDLYDYYPKQEQLQQECNTLANKDNAYMLEKMHMKDEDIKKEIDNLYEKVTSDIFNNETLPTSNKLEGLEIYKIKNMFKAGLRKEMENEQEEGSIDKDDADFKQKLNVASSIEVWNEILKEYGYKNGLEEKQTSNAIFKR